MNRLKFYPSPEGTITAFRQWYELAIPGEQLTYWSGNLQRDRRLGRNYEVLDELASCVLAHQQAGMVSLTQKRLGPLKYDYIVTRVSRRYK